MEILDGEVKGIDDLVAHADKNLIQGRVLSLAL